jgi:hypothetical protein
MDAFLDWLNGNWCDTFAALGLFLVTTDEVGDPGRLEADVPAPWQCRGGDRETGPADEPGYVATRMCRGRFVIIDAVSEPEAPTASMCGRGGARRDGARAH